MSVDRPPKLSWNLWKRTVRMRDRWNWLRIVSTGGLSDRVNARSAAHMLTLWYIFKTCFFVLLQLPPWSLVTMVWQWAETTSEMEHRKWKKQRMRRTMQGRGGMVSTDDPASLSVCAYSRPRTLLCWVDWEWIRWSGSLKMSVTFCQAVQPDSLKTARFISTSVRTSRLIRKPLKSK